MVADFLRVRNEYAQLTQQADIPAYARGEDWRFKPVALLGVTACSKCKTTWGRDKNAALNLTAKAHLIINGSNLPACWREGAGRQSRAADKLFKQ